MMRIAQVATLGRPVPPDGEGSVELLVSLVTEELVRRGHEVTLFALPSSRTSATLVSPVPRSYADDAAMWDWQLYENFQVREAFMRWSAFDVIHCHSYHFGLLYCDFVPVPSLHSFHIEPGPDFLFLAGNTRNRHLHFCSRFQARAFNEVPGKHVVPHGLDMEAYTPLPASEREGYLAFLGRFIPDKGADIAIEVARKAGIPLRLAGPENDYFRETIKPRLVAGKIDYVGEVAGKEKADFLARARALIYPVRTGEAFGLVMIEAMASGTPVVALNRGAVSEIIEHGTTGWIAQHADELVPAIEAAAQLDNEAIAAIARERFCHRRMVDGIESILTTLHKGAR